MFETIAYLCYYIYGDNMKKNGFTLIELISVIFLLAIMGMIVVPIVENSINGGKDDLYISQIDSIKASLKKYAIEKINQQMKNSGDDVYLSLYDLKIAGYVSVDIKDPRTEKLLPEDMLLRIEKREKSYAYEVLETTGTKSDKTYFSSSTPVLKVKPIVYYCKTTSEVTSELTQILNDYEINSGSASLEYYNTDFTKKLSLEALLDSGNDFRVVYKSNGAYAIMNVIRSGC